MTSGERKVGRGLRMDSELRATSGACTARGFLICCVCVYVVGIFGMSSCIPGQVQYSQERGWPLKHGLQWPLAAFLCAAALRKVFERPVKNLDLPTGLETGVPIAQVPAHQHGEDKIRSFG